MFGDLVRQENVNRTTRRVSYSLRDQTIPWRGNIGSTDSGMVRVDESGCKIFEPVWIRIGVIINVGDNLTRCGLHAEIAGV